MIDNKRILWGISTLVVLVNAIAVFLLLRRRRRARRSPAQSVVDFTSNAAKSLEQSADHVAKESRRRFKRLRREASKHSPF